MELKKAPEATGKIEIRLRDPIQRLLRDVLDVEIDRSQLTRKVMDTVLSVLQTLTAREAECLCLRYGITQPRKRNAEIGEAIGQVKDPSKPISPEMVGVLVARARRKLGHPTRS